MRNLETSDRLGTDNGSLEVRIQRDAASRADFTREFVEKKGMSLERLDEVAFKPHSIDVDFEDDESLALGVYNLQKKMAMPKEDTKWGTDGKLGPITFGILFKKKRGTLAEFVGEELKEIEDEVEQERAVVQEPVEVEPDDAAVEEIEETGELAQVSLRETVFVGDSLTYGMKPHIAGSVSLYKGGMQTKWMRRKFDKFLKDRKSGRYPNVERLVIMGGFNDISSTQGANHVIKNLEYIYRSAKAAGLSVVACTIPEWDIEKNHKVWVKRWKKRGWGRVKGVYPFSVKQLGAQTLKINSWIKNQEGGLVDAVIDTYNAGFNRAPDGIHRTALGYKKMANRIKEVGNIEG